MAQKVNIILIDDLDGSEASETISFGLDGSTYEIDLNEKHAKKLRSALADYVGNARKVSKRGGRSRSAAASGDSARDIREWARNNGHDVPARGRIPAAIREAYAAAN